MIIWSVCVCEEARSPAVELTLIDGICQIEEQKQKKTFKMNFVVQCVKSD